MNKTWKIVIISLLILILFASITRQNQSELTPAPTPTPTQMPTPIPSPTSTPKAQKVDNNTGNTPATDDEAMIAVFRSIFVDSCITTNDMSKDECRCAFNFMLDKYGIDKIIEEGAKLNDSKDYSSIMIFEALLECQK